jgi:hypothetical protein
MRWLSLALLVLPAGCAFGPNPSGLTQEQAEQKLAEAGFSDFSIGPSPEGWSGRAVRYHGYEMKVVVDKRGVTIKS